MSLASRNISNLYHELAVFNRMPIASRRSDVIVPGRFPWPLPINHQLDTPALNRHWADRRM
jgi:hypothetical protein